jgi:hypothetical protein
MKSFGVMVVLCVLGCGGTATVEAGEDRYVVTDEADELRCMTYPCSVMLVAYCDPFDDVLEGSCSFTENVDGTPRLLVEEQPEPYPPRVGWECSGWLQSGIGKIEAQAICSCNDHPQP